jgi:hypothetical protein
MLEMACACARQGTQPAPSHGSTQLTDACQQVAHSCLPLRSMPNFDACHHVAFTITDACQHVAFTNTDACKYVAFTITDAYISTYHVP